MSLKRCWKCKTEKDINDFYKCSKTYDGRQGACKSCLRALKRTPAYRLQARVNEYGITKAIYIEMVAVQGGRCAICLRIPHPGGKPLFIDHCHKTGTVRQLLCSNCNSGLGRFGESPDTILRAIAYLEKHEDLHKV